MCISSAKVGHFGSGNSGYLRFQKGRSRNKTPASTPEVSSIKKETSLVPLNSALGVLKDLIVTNHR